MMNRLIILAALALCWGCGSQGSTMMPTYLGEGQGIASQLLGVASQLQSYRMQEQPEQQLQRQQQQINSPGN